MREIKIDARNYEEIKIGEHVYKLDLSEEALNRYRMRFPEMGVLINDLLAAEVLDFDTLIKNFREIVNVMYLEEPFDAINAECGYNTTALTRVVRQSLDALTEIFRTK